MRAWRFHDHLTTQTMPADPAVSGLWALRAVLFTEDVGVVARHCHCVSAESLKLAPVYGSGNRHIHDIRSEAQGNPGETNGNTNQHSRLISGAVCAV